MTPLEQLKARFAKDGIERGGEFYVPSRVLGQVLEFCQSQGFGIGRLEAVEIQKSATVPRIEWSVDCAQFANSSASWDEFVERSYAFLRSQFLEQLPADLFFSVWPGRQLEWPRFSSRT